MPNLHEEWRAIPGYEGMYEASNLGRIRSLDRWVGARGGKKRRVRGRVRKQWERPDRRSTVTLTVDRQAKTFTTHRLVADAFLGSRPEGTQVNHRDGNPRNNAVTNLEYVTPSGNMRHAQAMGLREDGEHHWNASLTEEDVREIRRARQEDGTTFAALAERYGITLGHAWSVVKRKRWARMP